MLLLLSAVSPLRAEAPAPPRAERLGKAREALDASRFDEAIEGARAVMVQARDDRTKAGAMALLADAFRKKGDWAQAAKACAELKGHLDKGTAEYIRCEATLEVLKASLQGVYPPLAASGQPAPDPPAAGAKPATLADDTVLAKALALGGQARARKLAERT
jgi:hypothetical protein